jgi:hypothetical protein
MSRACRIHLPLLVSGLLLASSVLLPAPVLAQDSTCPSLECAAIPSPCSLGTPPPDRAKTMVSYFQRANVSACNVDATCDDPRASCESGRCNIRLQGALYKPSGRGPFPAVVLNPGSVKFGNHDPQPYYDAVKRFFWSRGFVVLVPSRRGYAPSTGTYIDDLIARQTAGGFPCTIGDHCETFDLQQEGQDVAAALRWLHRQRFVDGDRMALVGHSLGGIVRCSRAPSRTSSLVIR